MNPLTTFHISQLFVVLCRGYMFAAISGECELVSIHPSEILLTAKPLSTKHCTQLCHGTFVVMQEARWFHLQVTTVFSNWWFFLLIQGLNNWVHPTAGTRVVTSVGWLKTGVSGLSLVCVLLHDIVSWMVEHTTLFCPLSMFFRINVNAFLDTKKVLNA